MKNDFFKHILLSGGSKQNRAEIENAELPVTFSGNGHRLRNYRIYGNSVERKNLLKNTATSQTINGVTFTVNDDGSVTCNGTAVGIYNTFYIPFKASGGTYILNGCPKSGSDNSYRLDIRDSSGSVIAFDYGEGTGGVQLGDSAAYRITIRLQQNYICDNLTFYPMIRKANIEDSTYEPYIENTSVGDLQANGKYLVPVTVSGKNLAPTILPQSSGGINIQQIGDGIYSMSGTSQKQNNFVFTLNLSLPMGDYKIVNMGTVRIALDFKNISGATVFKSPNPGEAMSFSYPDNAQRGINIYVPILSNDTVDGTVKYMIIRASGEYNTYEPYHEPQTVSIELDAPLRKVGDEADYIDFREQKQYIVTDYVTADINNIVKNSSRAFGVQTNKKYVSGLKNIQSDKFEQGEKAVGNYCFINHNGDIRFNTLNEYSTVQDMLHDIGDIHFIAVLQNQIEVPISLPAIPTIDGTTVISVNTETQPSKVYLQGNITVVEAPTQSLQASPQTIDLQPLSLDVIIDKSEIQTDYISETENLETTGGNENAE